jgi:uncharacterized protein YjbI with pentapeptide repeats
MADETEHTGVPATPDAAGPTPAPGEPPPPPTAATLAGKAKDLQALRDTVVDAASVGAGLWFSYLFVLLYLLIAVGGVTHRELFLQSPVKLPFLNVDLPLLGFFWLGPAIFLVAHAYVLLHFVLLAGKVGDFDAELRAQITDKDVQRRVRRQLPSNIFVQFLAGSPDVCNSRVGFLLQLIAWISLVVGPIALLVFFELQFLPYHDWAISWWHRIAVLADIALLWTLWPSIARGETAGLAWRDLRRGKIVALVFASLAPVLLVTTIATFPGEWLEDTLPSLHFIPWKDKRDKPWRRASLHELLAAEDVAPLRKLVSLREFLVAGEVNFAARKPKSLWSNRLVLPGFDAIDHAKFDSEAKIEALPETISLRARHLEGAVLIGAKLRKSDFTGAQLQGAQLYSADLRGAKFECAKPAPVEQCAQLQGASLMGARLQGASLIAAQLQGAKFNDAQLQGAKFNDAQLQGANFSDAQLQGALLGGADLRGASLVGTQLQGASLNKAQLQGAKKFSFADLRGASLMGAQLQGAKFNDAQLQGANFSDAQLQGANLFAAPLQGASLDGAELQGALLNYAHLEGASLNGTHLQGASLQGALLQGASLDGASLQGALLQGAQVQGASLANVFTWRTDAREAVWEETRVINPETRPKYECLKDVETPICDWSPVEFDDLKKMIVEQVPEGDRRRDAMEGIDRLDPKPLAGEEEMAKVWKRRARSSPAIKVYEKRLAGIWRETGCAFRGAPYVLRGLLVQISRFGAQGPQLPALAKAFLDEKHCPGAHGLSDAEKATLKEIRDRSPPHSPKP